MFWKILNEQSIHNTVHAAAPPQISYGFPCQHLPHFLQVSHHPPIFILSSLSRYYSSLELHGCELVGQKQQYSHYSVWQKLQLHNWGEIHLKQHSYFHAPAFSEDNNEHGQLRITQQLINQYYFRLELTEALQLK